MFAKEQQHANAVIIESSTLRGSLFSHNTDEKMGNNFRNYNLKMSVCLQKHVPPNHLEISLITYSGVMEQLDVGIVPYIVLLVVPVLGRMSDQTDSVRFMATQCFATLIRLMPLEVS